MSCIAVDKMETSCSKQNIVGKGHEGKAWACSRDLRELRPASMLPCPRTACTHCSTLDSKLQEPEQQTQHLEDPIEIVMKAVSASNLLN